MGMMVDGMSEGRKVVHRMNRMVRRGMDVFSPPLHPSIIVIMPKKNNFIHGLTYEGGWDE